VKPPLDALFGDLFAGIDQAVASFSLSAAVVETG
jgi:hypothetical protein